ncbi:MAG TPA: hypothetical protein VH817_09240 [Thermoleophilaceae bacterium]
MIQSVDNSSAPQASSAAKSANTGSNGGTFASVLASAQSGSSSGQGTITGDLKTDLTPPKGETWGPVDGHTDYADILSGPRNGFYVSLTGPRKGQAFVITHQHGKTFHVYGEGKHKVSIPVPTDPSTLKPPKGETWKAVAHHHDYKKIHGGDRTNQYVNLSGNARTGEAFKIEHHDGKTWHVYGGGREVAVGGHRQQTQQQQGTTGNPSQPG